MVENGSGEPMGDEAVLPGFQARVDGQDLFQVTLSCVMQGGKALSVADL